MTLEEEADLALLRSRRPRIADVSVCAPHTVRVEYADGVVGNVSFQGAYLEGVFKPLSDPAFFAQVGLDHGALAWSDDLAFCADAIYLQVAKNGEWVLR